MAWVDPKAIFLTVVIVGAVFLVAKIIERKFNQRSK